MKYNNKFDQFIEYIINQNYLSVLITRRRKFWNNTIYHESEKMKEKK